MAVKIVTDSTAYLTEDIVTRYDIRVVPLRVLFEEQAYRDGIDLSNDEFYRMLAAARKLPTTSQPPVGDFQEAYGELLAQGHEIVSIHISSKLSGTMESARAAAEHFPGAPLHIVDSHSTSLGLAMMVISAASAALAGQSAAQIVQRLEQMRRDTTLLFVVDTLEYLEKGGRIGAARALLGTLLKIKPILKIEDGAIVPFTTVRTKRKAVSYMVDYLAGLAGERRVLASVAHAQAPEEVAQLEAMLRGRLNCDNLFVGEIGPVIATHGGPGLVGAAICPVEPPP